MATSKQEALPRPGIAHHRRTCSPTSSCSRRSATCSESKSADMATARGTRHRTSAPARSGRLRAGVFVVGAIAGWFAGIVVNRLLGAFFRGFNWFFDVTINRLRPEWSPACLRVSVIALLVYAGLMGLTYSGFKAVPVGFIPEQDKGYLVLNAQLPDGAALDRTDKVVREMSEIAREEPGVAHTIDLPGYSAVLGTNISNVGGMFVILDPFEERAGKPELGAPAIIDAAAARSSARSRRRGSACSAPRRSKASARTGGFKLQVQDRAQRRPARTARRGRKPGRRGQPRSATGRAVQQLQRHAAAALRRRRRGKGQGPADQPQGHRRHVAGLSRARST